MFDSKVDPMFFHPKEVVTRHYSRKYDSMEFAREAAIIMRAFIIGNLYQESTEDHYITFNIANHLNVRGQIEVQVFEDLLAATLKRFEWYGVQVTFPDPSLGPTIKLYYEKPKDSSTYVNTNSDFGEWEEEIFDNGFNSNPDAVVSLVAEEKGVLFELADRCHDIWSGDDGEPDYDDVSLGLIPPCKEIEDVWFELTGLDESFYRHVGKFKSEEE